MPLLRYHLLAAVLILHVSPSYTADADSTNSGRIDLDRIVAVVNDDVITQTELDARLRTIKQQMLSQSRALPADKLLERQILDRLIISSLQLQLASKTGLRVDDQTLNRTIEKIAADNNLSLSEFRDTLEKEGYRYANFREDIRNEIVITRLRQREVVERITVTEQDIDNFLSNQAAQGNTDTEYHLAHILIAIPGAASPEQIQAAKEKSEAILSNLRSGADFHQTAITSSDGQQALQGGDLGWRKLAELPPLFVESLNKMKDGDISEVIRSTSGFHIIKLLEQRSGEERVITQTLARHIMIATADISGDEKAQSLLADLRQQIIGGADFVELALKYSSDKSTAASGGSLGWVKPGDLPAEIESALADLKNGEITPPIKTGDGWHIIQALERRREDDTANFLRTQAREAIRQRKIEEEYQLWIRRLRDEAYVENRLDAASE